LLHANYLKQVTNRSITQNGLIVALYVLVARLFGLTFAIKLLEKSEKNAERIYVQLSKTDTKFACMVVEEKKHETQLLKLIDEEQLKYTSSMILGFNDAIVGLTGTVAGLSLSLQDHRLIGVSALIAGLVSAMSMAVSEYVSKRTELARIDHKKAALYTGGAYVVTTLILVSPYFILHDYIVCLIFTLINAFLLILCTSFYLSVTIKRSYTKIFFEGITLSFGVAFISFVIGLLAHQYLHVDI